MSANRNPGISAENIIGLPRPAITAFAARCARRVEPLFARNWSDAPDFRVKALDQAITAAERSAAAPPEQVLSLRTQAEFTVNMVKAAADAADGAIRQVAESGHSGINPAGAVARAAASAAAVAVARDLSGAAAAAAECVAQIVSIRPALLGPIQRDLDNLKRAAKREEWNNQTQVTQRYFCLHSEFEISKRIGDRSIAEMCGAINENLSAFYAQNSEKLYSLTNSGFLEVLSEHLEPCGFAVEMHLRTRDGGHDLAGIFNRAANLKYLLECKAYGIEKRIDIRPVMTLNGATLDTPAIKGLIATSARHTEIETATGMYERNQYLLLSADFDKLLEWLAGYQKHFLQSSSAG